MRGSSTPPVNQVPTINSHNSLIFSLSLEIDAIPSNCKKSECSEPWKYSFTVGSSANSRFLWLSSALKNQRFPSLSTCCTLIGRECEPKLTEVQKKHVLLLSTICLILSTAASAAKSS